MSYGCSVSASLLSKPVLWRQKLKGKIIGRCIASTPLKRSVCHTSCMHTSDTHTSEQTRDAHTSDTHTSDTGTSDTHLLFVTHGALLTVGGKIISRYLT